MGSSLRWIIEGKLVFQTPGKDAKGQSQERKHPQEIEWPTFAQTIHIHRNRNGILGNHSPQHKRARGSKKSSFH